MKIAIILSSGKGKRIWPYSETRNKSMIRIANEPILKHIVDNLEEVGYEKIYVISFLFTQEIKNYFKTNKKVEVITEDSPKGTTYSLLKAYDFILGKKDEVSVFLGDTIIEKEDIISLNKSNTDIKVLVNEISEEKISTSVAVKIEENKIKDILGHPRKDGYKYEISAYTLTSKYIENYLRYSKDCFENLQVGMMPSEENSIENSMLEYIEEEKGIEVIAANKNIYNIDYPWDILEATKYITEKKCGKLDENILGKGALIHEGALIEGYVKLGENSKIGRNVVIKGNALVGDNTIIDNGAIINDNVIIGNNCSISNYCHISDNTTIDDECIIDHCAEIEGILYKKVYLCHFMEIYGIIGRNTDIGAGTLFGSLRFDDGKTKHIINESYITPKNYSNFIYMGDYSRTGVGALIMPGVKIGARSIVGSGVLLERDLPSRKSVFLKQKLGIKDWSENKYGW